VEKKTIQLFLFSCSKNLVQRLISSQKNRNQPQRFIPYKKILHGCFSMRSSSAI